MLRALGNKEELVELSEIISILALVVASGSALYARWSWREAKRANDIATHEKQLSIYKAFESLKFAMVQKADSITHEDTGKFYTASRDSEFYFTPDIHNKIKEYFDVCFDLAVINRNKQTRNYEGEKLDEVHNNQDSLLEKEARLANEIDSELRKVCTIVESKGGIVMPMKKG